jgi:hypothetical protein
MILAMGVGTAHGSLWALREMPLMLCPLKLGVGENIVRCTAVVMDVVLADSGQTNKGP